MLQQLHLHLELCVQRRDGPPKTSLGLSLTTAPAPTPELTTAPAPTKQVLQCLQRGEGPPKVRLTLTLNLTLTLTLTLP